jgi:molecular chaperone GrpE
MSSENDRGVTDPPADVVPSEETGVAGVDAVPRPPLSREEIEAIRRERDDLQDQLLRKRAEFENYRKRVDRDRQQAASDAATEVLTGLLNTLDNLERALQTESTDRSLRDGVELTYRGLVSFLESQGVTIRDPRGEKFDPRNHQALSYEDVAGADDETIVDVFRKAVFHKDRLLRPALVKVARGGGDASSEAGHES